MKIGSLFDGSGGFPLAASLCGGIPVWASEIEPYPIAVTRNRFPNMKHLGDITKINGAEIEPVDIITFGSPCQDLSVAGKRAGKVSFEREGLRGNFATFRTAGQGTAGDAANRTGADDCEGAIPINTMIATRHKQLGRGTGFGVGEAGDPQFTISAGHEHDVAYTLKIRSGCEGGGKGALIQEDKSPCLNCNHEQPIIFDKEVYNSGENATGGHYISVGGPSPTLRGTGHPPGVCVRYIVRRLTPTECARLQGFSDRHGDIDPKDDFTDDEYRFWLDVRNTHAAINGKPAKDYTKKQMLTWYNKLHTDSAEYKMYGNGIALPCALYVMQGIQDALEVAV